MPARARGLPIACSPRRPKRRPQPVGQTDASTLCRIFKTQRRRGTETQRGQFREKRAMNKILSFAIVLSCVMASARAQEWGDLEGTFVFKGTPPTPTKIN